MKNPITAFKEFDSRQVDKAANDPSFVRGITRAFVWGGVKGLAYGTLGLLLIAGIGIAAGKIEEN